MSKISIDQIKKLRTKTAGVSVSLCKEALENSGGNFDKALADLRKKGAKIAQERQEKAVTQGVIEAYVHTNQKIGVILELLCETDFVARNDEFKTLAHELAMHIAAMNPKDAKELLKQSYIKDEKITINELICEKIASLGENIQIKRFERYEIG